MAFDVLAEGNLRGLKIVQDCIAQSDCITPSRAIDDVLVTTMIGTVLVKNWIHVAEGRADSQPKAFGDLQMERKLGLRIDEKVKHGIQPKNLFVVGGIQSLQEFLLRLLKKLDILITEPWGGDFCHLAFERPADVENLDDLRLSPLWHQDGILVGRLKDAIGN